MTLAELLQVCGIRVPHAPERSFAETEEILEEEFGGQDIRRFSGHLETGAEELHVYMLAEEANAEEARIDFVNSGVMAFDGAGLFDLLAGIGNANAKGEY